MLVAAAGPELLVGVDAGAGALRPAPLPGADTRQVCREVLAMDDTDIEDLITNGVLFSTADAEQRGVPG